MQYRASQCRAGREDITLDLQYPVYALQKTVYLESQGKEMFRQARPRHAWRLYQELTSFSPANQEALFDMAQVECALGLCRDEAETYQRLLAIDPLHNLAARQLELLQRRRAPRIGVAYSFLNESGRDELSELNMNAIGILGRLPFPCCGYLDISLQEQRYSFGEPSGLAARELGLSLQTVLDHRWRLEAGLDFARYQGDYPGSSGGRLRLQYSPIDPLTLGFAVSRERLLGNRYSLGERIYEDQLQLDLYSRPTRKLDIASRVALSNYSDRNQGLVAAISPGLWLTDHPKEFKLSLAAEYRDTDKKTQARYSPGGQLVEVLRHPYWAPERLWQLGLLLEWRHDLATSFTCGGLEHYYHIRLAPGLASDQNNAIRLEADYRYDINKRLRLELGGMLHRSKDWDSHGLKLSIYWYF